MNNKIIKTAIVVLVVGLIAGLGYLLFDTRQEVSSLRNEIAEKDQKLEQFRTDPDAIAQEETERYIEEVGKLYALPENEDPQVGIVTSRDDSIKKFGEFFEKSENGDVALFYVKSGIAILYRPSTKQIINSSTLSISDEAGNDSQSTKNSTAETENN